MVEDRELMPISQVEVEVGVSRTKLWRMIRNGDVQAFVNPRDRRQKLLDLKEVRRALEPELFRPDEGKAAA